MKRNPRPNIPRAIPKPKAQEDLPPDRDLRLLTLLGLATLYHNGCGRQALINWEEGTWQAAGRGK